MGWDSGSYVDVISIPDFGGSGSVGFDSPQPLPADIVAADNAAAANLMANISGQAPAFESPLPFDTTQIPAELNAQLQSFTQSLMSQLVSIQGLTSNLTTEQKAVNDAAASYTKAYNANAGNVAYYKQKAAIEQNSANHQTIDSYRNAANANVRYWTNLANQAQATIDNAKATYTADLKAYQDNLANLKSTVTDYAKNYTDYTKAVKTGEVDAKTVADAKAAADKAKSGDKTSPTTPTTPPTTGPGTGGTGGGGTGDTPGGGKDPIGTPSTDPSKITTPPSTDPTKPTTPTTPPVTPPTPDVPTPPDEPKAKDPYVPLQPPDDWNLQFRLGPLNLKGGGGGKSSAPVYASSDPLATSLLGTGLSTRPDVSSTESPYLLGTDEAKKNVWNTESLKNALGI